MRTSQRVRDLERRVADLEARIEGRAPEAPSRAAAPATPASVPQRHESSPVDTTDGTAGAPRPRPTIQKAAPRVQRTDKS